MAKKRWFAYWMNKNNKATKTWDLWEEKDYGKISYRELIQAFEEDSQDNQDNQDEQDSELNQEQVNKTRRIGAIAAGVILGLFALGFIYSICQSILF